MFSAVVLWSKTSKRKKKVLHILHLRKPNVRLICCGNYIHCTTVKKKKKKKHIPRVWYLDHIPPLTLILFCKARDPPLGYDSPVEKSLWCGNSLLMPPGTSHICMEGSD